METRSNDLLDQTASATSTTPDDVAALFSWANVPGTPYRDFSASRRQQRAQIRLRNAEQAREGELAAEMEATAAAGEAETLAEQAAAFSHSTPSAEARERASFIADEAERVAAAERIEAARRAEVAAQASLLAEQSQREIGDAAVSARRQEILYEQSAARSSAPVLPGEISDPYGMTPDLSHSSERRFSADRRDVALSFDPEDRGSAAPVDSASGPVENDRRSEPSVTESPRADTPGRRRDDSFRSEAPRAGDLDRLRLCRGLPG